MTEPLAQVLILLAAAVFAVTVVRRMGLPATLAYLAVGLALGPHAFAFVSESANHLAARRAGRRLPALHPGPGVLASRA